MNHLMKLGAPGFFNGVENIGGGGSSKFEEGEGRVAWILKLPGTSLQVCKFTKNEILHTYFSRILARF